MAQDESPLGSIAENAKKVLARRKAAKRDLGSRLGSVIDLQDLAKNAGLFSSEKSPPTPPSSETIGNISFNEVNQLKLDEYTETKPEDNTDASKGANTGSFTEENTEANAKSNAETKQETNTDVKTKTFSEADTSTNTEANTQANTHTNTETKQEASTGTETEVYTDAFADTNPEANTETKQEGNAEAFPETDQDAFTEANQDAITEDFSEAKAESFTETITEANAQTETDSVLASANPKISPSEANTETNTEATSAKASGSASVLASWITSEANTEAEPEASVSTESSYQKATRLLPRDIFHFLRGLPSSLHISCRALDLINGGEEFIPITAKDWAELAGISYSTFKDIPRKLHTKKLIEHKKAKKNEYFNGLIVRLNPTMAPHLRIYWKCFEESLKPRIHRPRNTESKPEEKPDTKPEANTKTNTTPEPEAFPNASTEANTKGGSVLASVLASGFENLEQIDRLIKILNQSIQKKDLEDAFPSLVLKGLTVQEFKSWIQAKALKGSPWDTFHSDLDRLEFMAARPDSIPSQTPVPEYKLLRYLKACFAAGNVAIPKDYKLPEERIAEEMEKARMRREAAKRKILEEETRAWLEPFQEGWENGDEEIREKVAVMYQQAHYARLRENVDPFKGLDRWMVYYRDNVRGK